MNPTILSKNYTGRTLVVVFQDDKGVQTKIVESKHPNWVQVVEAYKANDVTALLDLLDISKAINAKFEGAFSVRDGKIYYRDEKDPVHGFLFDTILSWMTQGLPYKHVLRFAENLYANPSYRARNELFGFLNHRNMPIQEDGTFLAYKGVQNDFFSKTGGKIKVLKGTVNAAGQIFNGVGEEIIVERAGVNDDCAIGCADGLHAGSWTYADGFKGSDGRMVIVKINPKDVVSIPKDCNEQKLRCCAYTVLAEENRKLSDVRDIHLSVSVEVKPVEVKAPEPTPEPAPAPATPSASVGYHNKRDAKGRFTA